MTTLRLRLTLGFVAALSLSILPLPSFISACRPPWILLLALYSEYYLPGNCKYITFLFLGLILDVLLSTVIGEHAFALLLVMWIASSRSRRFQFFSMVQQICLVGFFCLMYNLVICLINALLGYNYNLFAPFVSAILGMFFWPWIRLLADDTLLVRLSYRS